MDIAPIRMTRRLALLLPILALAGCGLGSLIDSGPRVSIGSVTVVAEPGANRNRPVAVDLVLIKAEGAIDQIGALSASDWFRRKGQFDRDFPQGLTVLSWEPVPALNLPARELTDAERDGARAAFVFADYATPGDHRARLESADAIRLTLQSDDFTVEKITR